MSYITSSSIISPLGFSSKETFGQLVAGQSSVRKIEDHFLSPDPFWASLIDSHVLEAAWSDLSKSDVFTRFEKIAILSVQRAIENTAVNIQSKETGMILCSTKGNVDLLRTSAHRFEPDRIYLWKSAEEIGKFFKNPNRPVVISNACISGLLGMIAGHRMLESGIYKNVVVVGADVVSAFVVSGFQSFKSLANGICKPFDVNRDGLNLGEGAATVVMSIKKNSDENPRMLGGASTNDANHISGPSRTGEGLFRAIESSFSQAGMGAERTDFVSAHGTGTPYNDEMEARALALAGLNQVPVNSLKGYFGHTLGAAGLMETAVLLESMRTDIIPATKGLETPGVSVDLNISGSNREANFTIGLKTGSGFGGCNAAAIFSKD